MSSLNCPFSCFYCLIRICCLCIYLYVHLLVFYWLFFFIFILYFTFYLFPCLSFVFLFYL
ncbi:hypothetical protein LDENG_00232540 [Lucifuga dentata]|nr:hypothetical protein LDENG_00232540 [Lucifuga dentata]